jgi:hypothetical protein
MKIFEEYYEDYKDFGKVFRLFFLRFWIISEEYEDFARMLRF